MNELEKEKNVNITKGEMLIFIKAMEEQVQEIRGSVNFPMEFNKIQYIINDTNNGINMIESSLFLLCRKTLE
ncbi:hypothetical protein KM803_15225 [Clostridium tyrobutyricum]|uniref:hypothetical protein n=1 Tax=Clostridium tyrobutyricum TaxID=1519 RepID=UPI001C3948E9|nr:hypothetical protein [Clostridium tyrobutyricum]MBV4432656.1 hypothetical protein [Clostridium tyrobutyricum]